MAEGLTRRHRGQAIATLVMSIVLVATGSTMTNIGLPILGRVFDASPTQLVWVVTAYQTATVLTLLPMAAIGERVGIRTVFLCGTGFFVAASLFCACASSIEMLIAGRAMQGLGAAATYSVMGAAVRLTYPPASLGRGIAINAFVVAVSSSLGPVVGSAVLSIAPWQCLFLIGVPIGLAVLVLGRKLPVSERHRHPFDWTGAALNVLTFAPLIVGVGQIQRAPALAGGLLATAAVFLVLLIWHERSIRRPLLPVDLLRIPSMAFAAATSMLFFGVYMTLLVSLPLFLTWELALPPLEVGILASLIPVTTAPATLVAGRLADRLRPEMLCLAGISLAVAGLAIILALPPQFDRPAGIAGLCLVGLGFGMFQTPNNRLLLGEAPLERIGGAAGLQAMARELGFALGASTLGLTFALLPQQGPRAGLVLALVIATLTTLIAAARFAWSRRRV